MIFNTNNIRIFCFNTVKDYLTNVNLLRTIIEKIIINKININLKL